MSVMWRPPPRTGTDSKHGIATTPFPPERLDADIEFLTRYGFDHALLLGVQLRAKSFRMTSTDMAIRHGIVSESVYYRCLAHDLGLSYCATAPPAPEPFFTHWPAARIAGASRYIRGLGVSQGYWQGHIAPDAEMIDVLRKGLANDEEGQLRAELAVTPRSANQAVLEKQCEPSLLHQARKGLEEAHPAASAERVIDARQAVVLLVVVQIAVALLWFAPQGLLLVLHLLASAFYLSCVVLRLLAAASLKPEDRVAVAPHKRTIQRDQDHLLPVYSIMVPLYGEAGEVPGLLQALLRMDWPLERMEIKLICEGDDPETIAAAKACLEAVPPGLADLVVVPPNHPRTKPKALNFALPMCRGEYVVVYDAEDRPDPLQLREAFARFYTSEPQLGCLQAPLVIHNGGTAFLPSLFTAEYACLFDGLLPFLARSRSPLPLGGTSNHFRGVR